MIPEHWRRSTVGELCEIVKGSAAISKTSPGPFPLVTTGEEHRTADHYQFDGSAVCVPLISSTGHGHASLKRIHYVEGKFALANLLAALIVRNPEILLPRFLHLYLNYLKDQLIVPLMYGAANMSLNPKRLASIPVRFPPLPEQRRILKLVGVADELRELRSEANDRAAELLPAIFQDMFGDPGSNPKRWDLMEIGKIASLVTSGSTPRGGAAVYTSEGPYFLRSQNIRMNRLDLSDVACLPEEVHRSMARTHIRAGDVLLNITGASIGRVAWVENLSREANVSQHVCIIRPIPTVALPEFVSVCLSFPYFQQVINLTQSGASRQGLNHQQVRRLTIPLPPTSLQSIFAVRVSELKSLQTQQAEVRQQIAVLSRSILLRAFQGQL